MGLGRIFFGLNVFCLLLPLSVFSKDRILFENGDSISGTFLGKTETLIYFDSDYLGVVKIPSGAVQLILDTPIPLEASTSGEKEESPVVVKDAAPKPQETPAPPEPDKLVLTEEEEKPLTALNQLWESTERTLNRFVNDRVPSWFPRLPEDWKGMLKIGYDLNDAEKTSKRYFGEFDLEGDKPTINYFFKTYFSYAEQDRIQSENEWGLLSRFRFKLKSSDFIETLGSHDVDALYDPGERTTVSLGFGFKPLKTKRATFDYVAGGAVERLDLHEGEAATYFKLNVNENFEWKFGKHLTLKQSLRFYADPTENFNCNFRFDTGLQALIVGAFNLGMTYRLDYDSSIEAKANRQKTKFVTSIGVKF